MPISFPQFTAEELKLRSRASRVKHVRSIEGPAGEYMAMAYGVNRDSVLNTSQYFHVIDGLCPDIMHDMLEGALPYEVKLLLQYSNRVGGFFPLQVLNSGLRSFAYGSDSRDKAAQISATTLYSSDNKLKQSGIITLKLLLL